MHLPPPRAFSLRDQFSDIMNAAKGTHKGPTHGQIAGIILGSLVASGILLVIIIILYKRQRRKQSIEEATRLEQAVQAGARAARTGSFDWISPASRPASPSIALDPVRRIAADRERLRTLTSGSNSAHHAATAAEIARGEYDSSRPELDAHKSAPVLNPAFVAFKARHDEEYRRRGYSETEIMLRSQSGVGGSDLASSIFPYDSASAICGHGISGNVSQIGLSNEGASEEGGLTKLNDSEKNDRHELTGSSVGAEDIHGSLARLQRVEGAPPPVPRRLRPLMSEEELERRCRKIQSDIAHGLSNQGG